MVDSRRAPLFPPTPEVAKIHTLAELARHIRDSIQGLDVEERRIQLNLIFNISQSPVLPDVSDLVRDFEEALFGAQAVEAIDIWDSAPEPPSLECTLARIEAFLGPNGSVGNHMHSRLLADPNLNDPRVVYALILALMHEDEAVANDCKILLEGIELPHFEEILRDAYQTSQNPLQRVNLVGALSRFGTLANTEFMLGLLETAPAEFLSPILSFFTWHKKAFPEIVPYMLERLRKAEDGVRMDCVALAQEFLRLYPIRTLREYHEKEVSLWIKELLDDAIQEALERQLWSN